MKIIDLLRPGNITISCEIFPPKPGVSLDQFHGVIQGIAATSPHFISVTYGAGGSTSKRTLEIAEEIQEQHQIPALAHLTCITSSRAQIDDTLQALKEHNIKNILALRGDMPQDCSPNTPRDFQYAYQLIEEIKAQGDFCIGAACYPEGHVECPSKEMDIDHLKRKVESGCDFLTTQMFFDNNILYHFLYRALTKGIQVPIVAGIMPGHQQQTNQTNLRAVRHRTTCPVQSDCGAVRRSSARHETGWHRLCHRANYRLNCQWRQRYPFIYHE